MAYSRFEAEHRASLLYGDTEIDLTSGAEVFTDPNWSPTTPNTRMDVITVDGRNGDLVRGITRGNVGETIPIVLLGGNTYHTNKTIRQIERLFMAAERRQDSGRGEPLYLTYWPAGGKQHRTPIYSGRLQHEPGAMRAWGRGGIPVTLFVERPPWWESATEVELPLTNRYGTAITGGLQIDNHHDDYHDNHVQISAGSFPDLDGVYDAPMRLVLTNTNGMAPSWRNLFVGRFAEPGAGYAVSELINTLQAEHMAAGGTSINSASTSGSNFRRYSLTTTKTRIGLWALPADMSNVLAGGLAMMMMRLATAPDTDNAPRIQLWLEADTVSGQALMQTPDVPLSGRQLEALGILAIPPGKPGLDKDTQINLSVMAYADVASNLDIDFVQALPVESFRAYGQTVGGLPTDGALIDDGERVYIDTPATRYQLTTAQGYGPLTIRPAADQRFYFLFDEAPDMVISRTLNVQIFYRPRIMSI